MSPIFSATECLAMWRSWANRSLSCDYKPDALSRPGERDRDDPRLAAWSHVELWFMRNQDHARERGDWLRFGPNGPSLAAFEAWYEGHPHAKPLGKEAVRELDKRFGPLTLNEAMEITGTLRQSLQRAIARGTLRAWRPRGMGWCTNRHELEMWQQRFPKGRNRKARDGNTL